MNNGKICVSVCAKTADELIQQIKRAEDLADVIEIRFDCLKEGEFDFALQKVNELNCSKPFLATFRPKEEGGHRDLRASDRRSFWGNYKSGFSRIAKIVDCEWEFFSKNTHDWKFYDSIKSCQIICSFHNFQSPIKNSENLNRILQAMTDVETCVARFIKDTQIRPAIKADIIKIAVATNDITDSIPIWQLLTRAKSENKEIIPIAMGESGKWTRILGLAHGAFMTYASLNSNTETAPGQVSAKDLHEIYRAKELDENTEVYGILGSNTSVSMSPYIHNTAFEFHQLNSVFVPLQVQDLDEFMRRMVKSETREIELNFKGFSVTMPHKQSIIKHLDFLDETAEKIGAVNTVKIVNEKLYGYNTDAKGFIEPLKQVFGDLKDAKVAVFGAGGASRACVYALQKEGAEVTIFARNIEQGEKLAKELDVSFEEIRNPQSEIRNYDVIVNATPLGMRGKFEGESPLSAEQMKGVKLAYDLVYIPQETEFIKQAESIGIKTIGGLEMLLAQAVEQQRIWTDLNAPIDKIREIVLQKLV